MSRQGVDPRLADVSGLLGKDEIPNGGKLGPFVVVRKLGESRQSIVYAVVRKEERRALKVLRREAVRDKRAGPEVSHGEPHGGGHRPPRLAAGARGG